MSSDYQTLIERLRACGARQLADHPEQPNLFADVADVLASLEAEKQDAGPSLQPPLHAGLNDTDRAHIGGAVNELKRLMLIAQPDYAAAWNVQLDFLGSYSNPVVDGPN